MQRWTAVVFGALMAVVIGLVVTERGGGHRPGSTIAADAGVDAARAAPPPLTAVVDAGDPADAEAPDEPSLLTGEPLLIAMSDAGGTLLSGEPPPGLAPEAPKSVVFGVILVQYKGAQGASTKARSREDALALARQLADEAKADFKTAVSKGDKGSMENAGRMPRGMLEPAPEYVLFSLPKDGVSEPVDTPRGFWIAHRIE